MRETRWKTGRRNIDMSAHRLQVARSKKIHFEILCSIFAKYIENFYLGNISNSGENIDMSASRLQVEDPKKIHLAIFKEFGSLIHEAHRFFICNTGKNKNFYFGKFKEVERIQALIWEIFRREENIKTLN